MESLKSMFSPLTQVKGRTSMMIIVIQVALALGLWQVLGDDGLIPTPSRLSEQ